MNKTDLNLLAKFWQDIETNFYEKAIHLLIHFQQWQQEHGPIDDNDPNLPTIKRMIDAASLHKPEDVEHE